MIGTLNNFHQLEEMLGQGSIREFEPLSKHTYTRTGGIADLFVMPKNRSEVQMIATYAHKHEIPLTILGNGSNVIVSDKGIRGITMSMDNLHSIIGNGIQITAGSGAKLIDVSKSALTYELSGLEFACGIPGTVGGALVMNAGAYGGEIAHVLKKAVVITPSGEVMELQQGEFEFGYRRSVFGKEELIVVEATFELKKGILVEIKGKMDELTFLRESKQPLEYPSCGSVFKRPPNNFAGKLIQDCGLQGTRIGGAEVSTKHAGFIVNVDHATSTDYLRLIKYIQESVKKTFDVDLETEVKIIGEK